MVSYRTHSEVICFTFKSQNAVNPILLSFFFAGRKGGRGRGERRSLAWRVNICTILACCRVFLFKKISFVSILDFLCPIACYNTENRNKLWFMTALKGIWKKERMASDQEETLISCLQFRLFRRPSFANCSEMPRTRC